MSHALLHANVEFLVAFLIASIAIVLIALLAERLARRATAAARHAIVLAGLVAPVVLFAAALVELPSSGSVRGNVSIAIGAAAERSEAEWPCLLAGGWAVGVALSLLRTIKETRKPAIVREPAVIGILKPVIVLPPNHRFTPDELEAVFAHERAHIARRDNLVALVVRLVGALSWFDPLHLIARRRLVELRERVCDELVLARGCDPHAYAAALARSCESSLTSPAVASMSRLDLHERMESIMTHEPRRQRPAWITRSFVTAAVAAAAIAFAAIAPSPSLSAGEKPVRLSENKNIKPPKALSRADAVYTQEARKNRVEGQVVLDATIDEKGAVRDIDVIQTLPHGLDQAAVDALRKWRFEAATLDGKPVPVRLQLMFNFKVE
jgi:TonB family protein